MTVDTIVMDLVIHRIEQRWRITVAVIARSSAGEPFRTSRVYDIRMAGIRRMRRLPGTCLARRTVGRGRVADGGADKRTVT